MSQLDKLQRLTTKQWTVDVGGESIEMGLPDAGEFRELLKAARALSENAVEDPTETLSLLAKGVKATVRDVPDEDFAVELIVATGGMEHSPIVKKFREIFGLMAVDPDDVRDEIEEGELGN